MVVGGGAYTGNLRSTAVGMFTKNNSQWATAIGANATVESGSTYSVALGGGSVANGANTVANLTFNNDTQYGYEG
ncbi:hypothetical protein BKK56_02225 [Rodentibacter genomosp. 2]|nr:hypothetical protein BKK56_02225 [Rodentibacter genomosp. 2]